MRTKKRKEMEKKDWPLFINSDGKIDLAPDFPIILAEMAKRKGKKTKN